MYSSSPILNLWVIFNAYAQSKIEAGEFISV
jgi:hypothetical protein